MSNSQSCLQGRTEPAALYKQSFITKPIQQIKIDFQQQFNQIFVSDYIFKIHDTLIWIIASTYLQTTCCMIWRIYSNAYQLKHACKQMFGCILLSESEEDKWMCSVYHLCVPMCSLFKYFLTKLHHHFISFHLMSEKRRPCHFQRSIIRTKPLWESGSTERMSHNTA